MFFLFVLCTNFLFAATETETLSPLDQVTQLIDEKWAVTHNMGRRSDEYQQYIPICQTSCRV